MRFEFKLPDIGEGMVEGEIVKWHVKQGEQIAEDAPMLDVMTDKATVTIPAPKSGKVAERNGKEGEVVKVGTVLVVLETADAGSSPAAQQPRQAERHDGGRRVEEPSRVVAAAGSGVLASPATRRLAREKGVDLSRVAGSGPGGRVTGEDVRASSSPGAVAKTAARVEFHAPVSHPSGGEQRIPFRGLRRRIAEKMSASKQHAPHFTYVEECDCTDLVALRDAADASATAKGIRLTYLPFVIKAAVQALKEFPTLNSVLDEDKQEIVLKQYYNIGLGAATPEGLTVPVVKDADRKSILEIAAEINDLGDRARAGKLSLDELQGSTFTITSLGALGGMFATPIINYPEVAILGIHRINPRPVVRNGQIVARPMMYVSLSFDHRVVDGDVGARFANRIIEFLQNPALILVH